ncbi:hypothetical protein AB8U03_12760 [Clostridium sp. Mt-5]|uniref:Uncharacterized protein n=1 Tax=Clostridium moutaii TaxID=3240932 RepID=A0ABV4BW24_9CLOT
MEVLKRIGEIESGEQLLKSIKLNSDFGNEFNGMSIMWVFPKRR